jgi:hypothetical protein
LPPPLTADPFGSVGLAFAGAPPGTPQPSRARVL